jgi:DNA-binding LacI/PurR family transcriptional regulator
MPVVMIERRIEGYSSVRTDNVKGAYMAAEYLIKNGRKSPGIICGRLDCYDCINAKERNEGFIKALEDHGAVFDKNCSEYTGYKFDDGVAACRQMFDRGARPDAVFCAAGDTVALGFMKEARRLGIKVPGDIAVVGYDDILASSMVSPSLMTIRQPIIKMGREALSIILGTLNHEIKETVTTTFEPELIVRESA